MLCFSISSCQYRFVYFLLVYPISNLEMCEVFCAILHFLFTQIETN